MIYIEEVIIGKSCVERIVMVFDAVVLCSFTLRYETRVLQIIPDGSLVAESL